jgi:hypothetical protein
MVQQHEKLILRPSIMNEHHQAALPVPCQLHSTTTPLSIIFIADPIRQLCVHSEIVTAVFESAGTQGL